MVMGPVSQVHIYALYRLWQPALLLTGISNTTSLPLFLNLSVAAAAAAATVAFLSLFLIIIIIKLYINLWVMAKKNLTGKETGFHLYGYKYTQTSLWHNKFVIYFLFRPQH
jgi:hypothetical protein